MHIEKARKLKPGDRVHYPANRGDRAGYGTVRWVETGESVRFDGVLFKWVEVYMPAERHASMWPSCRL